MNEQHENENHSQEQPDFTARLCPGRDVILDVCPVCNRVQPFTRAVLAGVPLGQICTCAIEQRVLERGERH